MSSCVLVTDKSHRLFRDLMVVCRAFFDYVHPLHYEQISGTNDAMKGRDILISIYNERLFSGDQLNCLNFNVHPAPPAYPGRGSATLALFDGVREFGPVAHRMEAIADAGAIFAANPIPVFDFDNCETLFNRSERAGVDLLTRVLSCYKLEGDLPKANGMKWERRPMTKKQFDEWLICDKTNHEEVKRKVRAAKHSIYKGPYILSDGVKMGLVPFDWPDETVSVAGFHFSKDAV